MLPISSSTNQYSNFLQKILLVHAKRLSTGSGRGIGHSKYSEQHPVPRLAGASVFPEDPWLTLALAYSQYFSISLVDVFRRFQNFLEVSRSTRLVIIGRRLPAVFLSNHIPQDAMLALLSGLRRSNSHGCESQPTRPIQPYDSTNIIIKKWLWLF